MKYSKWIRYENYRGGINNLQVCSVKDERLNTVKVFTSTVHKADKYADTWIKNN